MNQDRHFPTVAGLEKELGGWLTIGGGGLGQGAALTLEPARPPQENSNG
jgi:hypothetical protein